MRGDQRAHINSQDSWGRTPLHAAALTDKSKCLDLLLTSGGNLSQVFEKQKQMYPMNGKFIFYMNQLFSHEYFIMIPLPSI